LNCRQPYPKALVADPDWLFSLLVITALVGIGTGHPAGVPMQIKVLAQISATEPSE
jgi:hypothetical protein